MFGLTEFNAEIVDTRSKNGDNIFEVLSTALTKRGAIRQAKLEVHPQIPLRDIELTRTIMDRDLGIRKRYLVTITHNYDKEY